MNLSLENTGSYPDLCKPLQVKTNNALPDNGKPAHGNDADFPLSRLDNLFGVSKELAFSFLMFHKNGEGDGPKFVWRSTC